MEQSEKMVLEAFEKYKYFTKITKQDRERVKKWLEEQEGISRKEKRFLEVVKEGVQEVNYDYWIAIIEPSVSKGKIFYTEGEKVGIGFSCNQWKQMSEEYEPNRGSRLATLHELFIWYALRIVNNFWTLDYVTNDSSNAGNYWDSPKSSKRIEKAGIRKCGGYCDGIGNTYKIVTTGDNFDLVGGACYDCGDDYHVSRVFFDCKPDYARKYGSGVLVLTK